MNSVFIAGGSLLVWANLVKSPVHHSLTHRQKNQQHWAHLMSKQSDVTVIVLGGGWRTLV